MDKLFVVEFRGKSYLVRAGTPEEAYQEAHDFLGGAIVSLETKVREVVFPPESNVAEL